MKGCYIMKNFNEKIILAKSAGQYSNNGYPLIFEMEKAHNPISFS